MSTQINFKPVFPSPLGFANFGESTRELNKKLIKDIEHNMTITEGKTKTFKKNQCSWQSYSGMELNYDSFEELRELIDRAMRPVLVKSGYRESHVMQLHTESLWANVCFDAGGFSRPHLHGSGRTLWSGVYYPKGIEEIENLDKFEEDEFIHLGFPPNIDGLLVIFDPAKTTKGLIKTATYTREFYGTEVSVIPRESLLILFPVWMLHMVSPLTKKSKRYSISFAINKTT